MSKQCTLESEWECRGGTTSTFGPYGSQGGSTCRRRHITSEMAGKSEWRYLAFKITSEAIECAVRRNGEGEALERSSQRPQRT